MKVRAVPVKLETSGLGGLRIRRATVRIRRAQYGSAEQQIRHQPTSPNWGPNDSFHESTSGPSETSGVGEPRTSIILPHICENLTVTARFISACLPDSPEH